MSPLALQQQLLVQSLLSHPASPEREQAQRRLEPWLHPHAARGLMAYRAHGHALAERCLTAAYPVVTQLIGADALRAVARSLWHTDPPQAGDIGEWGHTLPDWLAGCAELRPLPYLSDLARVEWALHRAAGAADAVLDAPSLGLLAGEGAAMLRLQFAPGTALFQSPWPVVDLIHHHQHGQPPLEALVARLQTPDRCHALVVREGWRSEVLELSLTEATFVAAVLAGRPLGEALDAALAAAPADAPPFDFPTWLLQSVQRGHITGVLP